MNRRAQAGVVRLLGVSRPEATVYLTGAALLAVLLTAAGAFDSDKLGLAHRLALWLAVSIISVAQTLALDGFATSRLAFAPGGRITAGALAVAGVIVLMAVELHLLKLTPLLPYEHDPFADFVLFLAPPIGAIAGIVVLTRIATAGGGKVRVSLRRLPAPPLRLDFDSAIAGYLPAPPRLADWPREPVLRIQAADHYLEVVTSTGRRFLRGRMKDVLRSMAGVDGVEGVHPHRSWWIARTDIARVQRRGRDYVIVAQDGAQVPVARSRVAELRKLGLL